MRYITKMSLRVFLIANIFFLNVILAFTQKHTLITDFSYSSGNQRFAINNFTPVVKKALEAYAKEDFSILVFPKGRYDF